MQRIKIRLRYLVTSLTACISMQVGAEACTYSEAMMALQSGNSVRGHALMQMAARDGDSRAEEFLRTLMPIPFSPAADVAVNQIDPAGDIRTEIVASAEK